ncbi:DUF2306 domain-containing protein [Kordiimonas lipolytica]|uniref:DUF2306 domain-containing protein n=1 Tax=Kordiimonas lipolytica TaxID=1662421 RepID=A0ABV8UDR2_9PROT|nr:DUF2306 domain-containing protein [Kordiimonas lipolytica]
MKTGMLVLMTILSVLVALYGWALIWPDSPVQNAGMAHHLAERPVGMYLHFGFGPLALAIGGLQFFARLRTRLPALHRWVGRTYVLACMLSAVGGIWLAIGSDNGPVAQLGFLLLGIAWIITTGFGYLRARGRQFADHQVWMMRSFSLTFGAVTLRIYLFLALGMMGLSFEVAYPAIAYISWVPNLLFAEWLLRRQATPRVAVGAAQATPKTS